MTKTKNGNIRLLWQVRINGELTLVRASLEQMEYQYRNYEGFGDYTLAEIVNFPADWPEI